MTENNQSEILTETQNNDIEQIIDNLTLFDDDLLSKVFDENIEATQLLLQIIMKRDDIRVIWVKGQDEFKNPIVGGRNIRLDIRAILGDGRQINVEVQRNTEGSHVRRARFHSSMLDSRMLREAQEFKDLKDSYVIFICEHDKFKRGLPVYHIDRYIRETKELFNDGSNIIYVNGKYEGDDDIGRLVHDFKCKKSSDVYYKEFAAGVRHFKETEEGREIMCEAVKKYGDQVAEKARIEAKLELQIANISKLIKKMNLTLEQAMDTLDISEEDRKVIIEKMH